MGVGFSTSDLIQRIRDYQDAHPELKKSHHFVFDCPLDAAHEGAPKYLWFGLNPGEGDKDWEIFNGNTEETRDFDFQREYGRSAGSIKRMRQLMQFLGPDVFRQTSHCELFFWCSKDAGTHFKKKYGWTFERNPHWEFCCEINRKLIERVQPKAVFAESLGRLPLYEKRLGLSGQFSHATSAGRMVEERILPTGASFYCFDHLRREAVQRGEGVHKGDGRRTARPNLMWDQLSGDGQPRP